MWGGARLSLLVRRPPFGLLYQPQMTDVYGAVSEMRIGIKPAPVPLYPPQIPQDLT
jgi:hypothetical protein